MTTTYCKFTKEAIDEIKKEFSKKKIIGSDKFVKLDDRTAEILLESRQRFDEYINSVHKTHNLTDWSSEMRAPAGTERFYRVRRCKDCDGEQYYHAAGRFIDTSLKHRCYIYDEISEEVEAILY